MEQDTNLEIADKGIRHHLTYDDALSFHHGNAIWGCTVAFRALQRAGKLLSKERLWDRETLYIISKHPGPGVQDTLEFVTHCISLGRLQLSCPSTERKCSSDLKYEWTINDGKLAALVRLRDDFVPASFFDLLDRVDTEAEQPGDKRELEDLKQKLTKQIWRESLEEIFPDPALESMA